jgi:N-acetylneuraminic acid mutarotase
MREQARIGLTRGLGLAGALLLVAAAIASSGLADGRAAVNGRSASSVLAGTWRRLPAAPAPAATAVTVSVWTGRQMVIFGRAHPKPPQGIDVGAAYNPATNKWRRLAPLKGPAGNFQGRYHAVWTGKEMLVSGPDDFQAYDPRSNRWRRPAPAPTAVDGGGLVGWTGRKMIEWGGGCCGDALSTGWAFDPVRNTWRKLPSSPLAPSQAPVGAWTGHEMIVLVSGIDPDGKPYPASFARFAAYNPVTNSWRRLAPPPAARFGDSVIWDGHELLVIGGAGAPRPGKPALLVRIGFAFDPATDRWRRLSPMPSGREDFAAVWTERRLLIWGGTTTAGGPPQSPPSGLAFDPSANSWSGLPRSPLTGRVTPTAAWTGRALILWGGLTSSPRYKVFTEGAAFTPAVR